MLRTTGLNCQASAELVVASKRTVTVRVLADGPGASAPILTPAWPIPVTSQNFSYSGGMAKTPKANMATARVSNLAVSLRFSLPLICPAPLTV